MRRVADGAGMRVVSDAVRRKGAAVGRLLSLAVDPAGAGASASAPATGVEKARASRSSTPPPATGRDGRKPPCAGGPSSRSGSNAMPNEPLLNAKSAIIVRFVAVRVQQRQQHARRLRLLTEMRLNCTVRLSRLPLHTGETHGRQTEYLQFNVILHKYRHLYRRPPVIFSGHLPTGVSRWEGARLLRELYRVR